MVFGSGIRRAYPQLKHVLAQAGGRKQLPLLKPRRGYPAGLFFDVEAPDGNHRRCRPQSSSVSRFTAGALGFLLLIQCGERPDLQRESFRFDTMPLSPSLQAWWNTSGLFPPPCARSIASLTLLSQARWRDQSVVTSPSSHSRLPTVWNSWLRKLGVQLSAAPTRNDDDIEHLIDGLARKPTGGLILLLDASVGSRPSFSIPHCQGVAIRNLRRD